MYISVSYTTIYGLTLILGIIQAVVCFLSMIGEIPVVEVVWLVFLSLETVFLIVCAVNYDPNLPLRSPNHNVYRIYVLSFLAIILTVLIFMGFAAYGWIIPEVAIMTYLYFCLPIWLNLLVSFFVLQETYNK